MKMSRRYVPWCIALAAFGALCAIGIETNRSGYQGPIYSTVRAIAPLTAWMVAWAFVAACAVVAAVTRRAGWWRVASLGAVCFALIWTGGLTWAHFIGGERLSLTGWALWLWFSFSNIRAAVAQNQFEVAP